MPLEVRIFPECTLLWVEGRGRVTDDDLIEYVQDYLVRQGLRNWDEAFDLRGADLLDVTYTGLSEVAASAAPTDPEESPTKIGILISEAVGIGVSRMYQSLREGKGGRRSVRIFWELSELLAWLALPEDWVPPSE